MTSSITGVNDRPRVVVALSRSLKDCARIHGTVAAPAEESPQPTFSETLYQDCSAVEIPPVRIPTVPDCGMKPLTMGSAVHA